MFNFTSGSVLSALLGAALLMATPQAFAQQTDDTVVVDVPSIDIPEDDGIVSYGTINLDQHEGLKAFFDGDFEKAEIEFEHEFRGLRRHQRAFENSVQDAALAADRSLTMAAAGVTAGASTSNGNPVLTPVFGSSNAAPKVMNKRGDGNTVLTDGEITYEDFGFSRYMAGLSEIKLGKFEEARDSLETSLFHDDTNFDARMRLGLLDILDRDFKAAAKQLKKIDKQRRRCERLSCDDLDELRNAAVVLAKEITGATATG